MKKILLLSCLLIQLGNTYGQTSLSGQINVYANFLSQETCANTITVDDASVLMPGMGVIIIQMQGANISLSNTASYGNITDFNGAGQYEYNRITDIVGNVLTLELALLHQYSGDATQVVGFQTYATANVDGTLFPASWNGNTGGVLALEVSGTLTLNANIDASGRGFRGGDALSISDNNCSFFINADDYAYAADNWRGAPKGEGIGSASSSEPHGRGAQANGGGGGNDHNSGGGGGSLIAAGGQGGQNNEPSTFGCDGEFPGRGGKTLPNDSNLAFAGGGGGSGHANNTNPSGGGNGGGIIFLKANAINFTGGSILANGTNSPNTNGDGGGGGGSGGSIFLLANSIDGTVQIISQGGGGGTVNNGGGERCFGPGGGGSGGVLWSNQSLTATLTGGSAGISTNSSVCNNTSNGAESGAAGVSGTITALPQGMPFNNVGFSVVLAVSDTVVCSGTVLDLVADLSGTGYTLQWQSLVAGEWENLVEVPGQVTGTQTATLQLETLAALSGSYRLTLLPANDCFGEIVSDPVSVTVLEAPAASPTFAANGTTVDFMANTSNGDQWEWTFLPDQGSTEENPTFTFPGAGTYSVILTVSNGCEVGTYTLIVVLNEPLVAQISSSSTEGCAPLTILFEDQSAGDINSRSWVFPGGEPATSTEATPVVTFPEVGTYEPMLTVSDGNSEASTSQLIEVFAPPVPEFNVITNELTISLQNNSQSASSYLWSFGDGNTSMLENPVHTYLMPGVYTVSLSASNEYCGVAIAQTISATITATNELAVFPLNVSPNPTNGLLQIEHWQNGQLVLYNTQGQPLRQWKRPQLQIDLSTFPAGVYLLRYSENGQQRWWRVVKI